MKQDIARKVSGPKPFMVAGYSLIALTFGVMGGWAATAKLDRAVIAPGVIDVASNRKEIQHLEGGIIERIVVTEGELVKEGDTLVRLNAVQAESSLQVITIRLRIAQAMEARLQAERRMADRIAFPETLVKDETPEIRAAVEDQLEIFRDRTSILTSQTGILKSRIEQLHREAEGLQAQKQAFEERVSILAEQLVRLRRGHESGVVQSNVVSTYEEEYVEVKANIGRMETEMAKVEKSVGETEFQILQAQQQYRERASSEYKEVSGQIQELSEHLKVARDVLERTGIRAPVSGTVQNIRFHTTGGVVRPGEVMMEIVPAEDSMVINAHVQPIDIDNVRPGLTAEVKFSAFASRFMPIVVGEVASVSKGSITPTDGRTPPYFLARINVSKGMVPDDIEERLSAGMPADVIISTGERTVADYLTSPLTDAIRKGMREE
ncbi:HlyD family type I secretion periplasmic adaptor subunit [Rhizobiaceae bacterium BDR2-2]|uniref:Membrane fusion protein (MFP) family protein n=1 Tax=Ectorhizobium quercum TaxID=2965071 RepID=A0AAE3SVH7_9HYPH|nr:HlyD family type I secretion periplasmic adaptor subunit [Ectorhizobium quercum]MCX8998227.1 HlyD family type I secretion periplasmic adaptor subunit [Ectorhizobium quercum]